MLISHSRWRRSDEVDNLNPYLQPGEVLPQLYNSLKEQTCKDFEWVIADDGSKDNTQEVVNAWLSNSDIQIRYFFKENGGKHTALNYAINMIDSELTFIVDSDDVLTVDAVETVLRYHRRYENESSICGYAFLRAYPDGKVNGKEFMPNERIASYMDARINSDDTMADKAEVFKTACLREFPFSEYQGETFLGEDIVWVRMARKYIMIHINKAIYIENYFSDGLTKNRRLNNIKSPIGCMNRAKEFMGPELKKKYKVKAALQYIIYGKFAGMGAAKILSAALNKKLTLICLISGLVLQKSLEAKVLF